MFIWRYVVTFSQIIIATNFLQRMAFCQICSFSIFKFAEITKWPNAMHCTKLVAINIWLKVTTYLHMNILYGTLVLVFHNYDLKKNTAAQRPKNDQIWLFFWPLGCHIFFLDHNYGKLKPRFRRGGSYEIML